MAKRTEIAVDYTRDVVRFLREQILRTERGRDYRLPKHHADALRLIFTWETIEDCERCQATEEPACVGHLKFRLLAWSEPKKSGKSLLCGLLTLWWAITRPGVEILLVANDLEQVQGRVFQAIKGLLKHNGHLDPGCKILEKSITLSNGSTITAMASDWRGIAGGNHALACIDEPAGVTEERAVRLLEELTPIPSEPDSWLLMAGVAGWTGESQHWEAIYKRGLAGEVIDPAFPIYRAGEMVMAWSTTPRMPTQTARYLREQEASLRPATYARLWGNRWVSPESRFIDGPLWDPCVDRDHVPMLPDKRIVVHAGYDIGVKHDTTAAVAITIQGDRVYLVRHQIWVPTPECPIDLEATVEQWTYELAHDFTYGSGWADPFQFHRSLGMLKKNGLPVYEYAQTPQHLTAMGQILLDTLKAKALVMYPDDTLRQMALNTTAIESPRGFRIAKERASRKIDGIIALSLALIGAIGAKDGAPVLTQEQEREMSYQEQRFLFAHGLGERPVYGGPNNIVVDHETRRPDMNWFSDGDLGDGGYSGSGPIDGLKF